MQDIKDKDKFFSKNLSLNCRGKLLNLSSPKVMGILNVTQDSFYDGGRYADPNTALERVREMISEGAHVIDIGGASSRPGAEIISSGDELNRLIPIVSLIRNEFPEIILSIDTYNSHVAKEMVQNFGVDMVNDISAGNIDAEMIPTICDLKVPYIIMHMNGIPGNMQENPQYHNVVDEIVQFFAHKVYQLRKQGVADIVIDPGFGFGKNMEHNYDLLSQFEAFQMFELPLMAGLSRKSMIYNLLETDSEHSLNGTTAAHMILLQKGVTFLRVHDVKEAMEAIKVFGESNKLKY
jgi:dihydropteroate synthase